ncbi:F-box protein-like [Dorcoceras hygrometricum]|uniref:F-box protein-like n=1 Tax=Dorcoceras hygrometricum TaxID=472368 RepID=A0A2Z7BLG6_9LAMI|nr:F-box protein-like [Dorcoceras hygrometricum]
MRSMGDSDFFLQENGFYNYGYGTLELHPIHVKGNHQSCSLPSKVVKYLGTYGKILGSFNGFLCCGKLGKNPLLLLNPTTRTYMQVPIPDESLIGSQLRFGLIIDSDHNENTDDYVLLSVVTPHEWNAGFRFNILSPSEMIWTDFATIDFGGRNMILESSIQVKGVVYLVSDGGLYFEKGSEFFWPYLVSHDMKTHTSKFLQIPKRARKGSCYSNLVISKWGSRSGSGDTDTICLVGLWRNKFSVWILCSSTDNPCLYWRSVFHMRIKAMGLREIDQAKVAGYSVVNGRTLIFATEEKVYGYDLWDGTNGKIEELCSHGFDGADVCFHPFSSTLRCPGPDAGNRLKFGTKSSREVRPSVKV